MTTITQDVTDIAGVDDNTSWTFYTKAIRESDTGDAIISTKKVRKYPIAGVLTVELDPGPAVVTAADGKTYAFDVPEDDTELWPLIQLQVELPASTPQQQVTAAVEAYLEGNGSPFGVGLLTSDNAEDARDELGLGELVFIENFSPDVSYSTALSNAIDKAAAVGGTVTHKVGKTYTAHAGVTKTDLASCRIDWNGAKVVRATDMANVAVLQLNYTNSTIQNVVALTSQTYDWAIGSSQTTTVTRIELAATAGWAAGDYAKIVSDDVIVGSNPSDGQCEGESFRIAAVSGNYLYLARPLRVTLTTNVRIARLLGNGKDVDLTDPSFEDAAGSPSARNVPPVVIRQAVKPRVTRAKGKNLMTAAVVLSACVAPIVAGSDMDNLRTSSANDAFGYGFRLESCCDATVYGIKGSNLRHLFTTVAYFSPTGNPTDLWRYGGNIGHRVTGEARETGHAGFDTHEESSFVEFYNCYVGWNHREPSGTAYAYQLRGKNNVIRDSVSYGPCAFILSAYDGGGGHKVINHTHTVPAGAKALNPPSSVPVAYVNYSARSTRGTAEVSGRITAPDVAGYVFSAKKATVTISSLEITASNATDSPWWLIEVDDSELRIGTLVIDITGYPGSSVRIFNLLDSTSVVRVDRLIVRDGGTGLWRLADYNSLNGTVTVGTIECDGRPGNPATAGSVNVGATAVQVISDVRINQQSILTGIDVRGNSSVTMDTFSKGFQLWDTTLTNNRTVTEAPVGLYPGQTIMYYRGPTVTQAFNITIGGVEILSKASSYAVRMWTGTGWVTTNKGNTTDTLNGKTFNLNANTLTGTLAQFNTACSDADFASLAGTEELTGKTLTGVIIKGYTESVVAIGNTSTAKTISLTNGTVQTATLTGNCTFTMPAVGAGKSFVLYLFTGAGGFTGTFTGVKWSGGTAPTITTAASKMDVLSFVSDGTNWYGSFTQNYTP